MLEQKGKSASTSRRNKKNPMAKDLRQPKYHMRVVPDKTKTIPRKSKHKGEKE